MVFQKPNPFPKSIYENVAWGARINGYRGDMDELVERCLRRAALWDEVKDKLKQSGLSLSGGQQQRLCIARALAVEPDVILMDEPCSALDPIATLRIEELMRELSDNYTIVIVTHNMQQAARVSDLTAMMMLVGEKRAGSVIEFGADRDHVHPAEGQADRGLRHRAVWLERASVHAHGGLLRHPRQPARAGGRLGRTSSSRSPTPSTAWAIWSATAPFPTRSSTSCRAPGPDGAWATTTRASASTWSDCGCAYTRRRGPERAATSRLRWTQEHTTAENKAFLQALPMQIRLEESLAEVAPGARQPAQDQRVPV